MRLQAAAWSPALLLVVLIFFVLAVGFAPGSVVGTETQASGNISAAKTTIEIGIQSDGDARWRVTARFRLATDADRDAFEQLAGEYEDGDTEALSLQPFQEAVSAARAATGRDMQLINVVREGREGSLVLAFTWTEFAQRSGDRLEMGDTFQSETGTWLPRLGGNQELIVTFPDEYSIVDSSQPLRNGTFSIQGPASFSRGEPSAVLKRTEPRVTTSRRRTTSMRNGTSPGETPNEGIGLAGSISAALLVVVVVLVAYLMLGREGSEAGDDGAAGATETDPGGSGPPSGVSPSGEPEEGPEPLLADEERVLQLLEANGGRMKQVAIVEETDWSNAKVSQLLSEMADRGEIDKLRIGRENLISLPGESPRDGQ